MKKIFLLLIFLTHAHAAGGPPKEQKTGNACVSDNFCTYGEMPLQNQGAVTLKWYINKKENNWNVWDPGWCGAVAGMMALYGIKEHNKNIRWNSWLSDKTENKYGVWKTGLDFNTNFKKGGTSGYAASKGIEELLNKAQNYKNKYFKEENYPLVTSESVKNEIKAQKHVEYVSICKYKVENRRTITADLNLDQKMKERQAKVGYYEVLGKIDGCHALAMNGYDGTKIIINDPWGRVYTVDFENIFYGSQSGNNIYALPQTRVIYGKMKARTWDNFSHFMGHGGKQSTHTILTQRIKFSIYQP